MKLWCLVAFRDRPDLLARCLDSILSQDDPDFGVIVADDASEPTRELESTLIDYGASPRVLIGRQETHVGTLANQVMALRSVPMQPEDVICWVDGDDRLAHDGVLSRLREAYSNRLVDLTYGSYRPDPPSRTCPPVRWIPSEVCARGEYRAWHRAHGCRYNHLRTMRRRIFDAIPGTHLFPDGDRAMCAPDHFVMVPAFDLAGGRHVMLEEELLIYTSDRPEAEWRLRGAEITDNTNRVLSLPTLPALPPLERLP